MAGLNQVHFIVTMKRKERNVKSVDLLLDVIFSNHLVASNSLDDYFQGIENRCSKYLAYTQNILLLAFIIYFQLTVIFSGTRLETILINPISGFSNKDMLGQALVILLMLVVCLGD